MSAIAEPMIYPQSVSAGAGAGGASSSSPRESFGPVFVVLAVIAILAAVACVVGRLCAHRMRKRQAKYTQPRGSYDGKRETATERPTPPPPPPPRGFLTTKGDIEDGCYEIVFPVAKPVGGKQARGDNKRGNYTMNYPMNYPEIGGNKIGAVDSTTFKQAKPST